MGITLVGISGAKGAGKNTAGEILCREYGFKEVSFATPLKIICAEALGLPYSMFHDQGPKDSPFPGGPVRLDLVNLNQIVKLAHVYSTFSKQQANSVIHKGMRKILHTPREMLQYVGTDLFRELVDVEFWCQAFAKEITKYERVVVPDVRFPNERALITKLGGENILVERPGTESTNEHISESLRGDESEYVAKIINNSTVCNLHTNISNWYINIKR